MSKHIRSNVVGYIALFCFAVGGTAQALPGKNKVDSGDIKAGQVKLSDLGADSVDGSKVADNSLKGADVDESSLNIPQPTIPSSLPPSGAAGGDLAGTYPDPQVSESGLGAGGDLGGTLADAQIAAGAVGDAEIANRTGSLVFAASEIADAGMNMPQVGEPTVASNSFAPALAFGDGAFTDIVVDPVVPADRVPGSDLEVRIYWEAADAPAPGLSDVIWQAEALGVSAGEPVDDVLSPLVQAPPQGMGVADTLRVQTISLPGGAIQNGELLLLRITRMAGAGAEFAADTLAQNALLHAVELRYPTVR